jgi:hypothetical protein
MVSTISATAYLQSPPNPKAMWPMSRTPGALLLLYGSSKVAMSR